MRDYTATRRAESSVSCGGCCQVCVYAFTAFLLVAERTALIYCFVYYLWVGHNYCYAHLAGLTALFLLPGWAPQLLSYLWYLSDGRIRRKSLTWTHILHLGLFKRLWDVMRRYGDEHCSEIMQEADISALRLFEALVVTLPQTTLQTYVLICTDIGLSSPTSVCFVVCMLSLAWALVLYARACSLIRPFHLPMTPAAMLCRLLWRIGMLGARLATLMLFTRVFRQWVLGVIGVHWLAATFWLVSQQTDIIRSTGRWRLFNLVLGAVHIFLFLNVKDGPSRYRMAGFYLAMFIENALLLLASSWFFSNASWDGLGIPAAVFCSFLIGLIALVLYYRFLHPKSFDIFMSIRHRGIGGACMERGSTLSLEEKTTPTSHRDGILRYSHLLELPAQWEGWRHHHWLLIRLALKTGDAAKICHCYGDGGLAGLMGLPEPVLTSPDDVQHFPNVPPVPPQVPQVTPVPPAPTVPAVPTVPMVPQVPQVTEVRQVIEVPKVRKTTPPREIVKEIKQAAPAKIVEVDSPPEVFPVQEVMVDEGHGRPSEPAVPEKDEEEDHPAAPRSFSEKEEEDFLSAAYCSPSLSSPGSKPDIRHIDSNPVTLTEGSSPSLGSLDIKLAWSPERRSPLVLGTPERNPNTGEPLNDPSYFRQDYHSPSSGSYLGWGSELSPISTYRSPYRFREARFAASSPQPAPLAGEEEEASGPTPDFLAVPSTSSPARKQMVQFIGHNERAV